MVWSILSQWIDWLSMDYINARTTFTATITGKREISNNWQSCVQDVQRYIPEGV